MSVLRSAAFLDRGNKAVTAYVNACEDGDRYRLQATLTDDARVELPFAEPGTFLVADSGSAADFCHTVPAGNTGHVAAIRMYAADSHARFAAVTQRGDKPHLLMIEMRGSRILRLRDFTADSDQVKRYAAGQQTHYQDPS